MVRSWNSDEPGAEEVLARRRVRGRHAGVGTRIGVAFSVMLVAFGNPALAQDPGGSAEVPVRQGSAWRLAPSSSRIDKGPRAMFLRTQMLIQPGIEAMPQDIQRVLLTPGNPVIIPVPGDASGAMAKTGRGYSEMLAGACAAGLFIGALSTVVVAASGTAIAAAAGVGCGIAVAATTAGIVGMLAWRSAADAF